MNDPQVVGPIDTALKLATGATITATTNGTAIDLGSGFAPGGGGEPMGAIIPITSYDFTTGDETYAFKLQESSDNSSWVDASRSATVVTDGPAASSGGAITVNGVILVGGFIRKRYVRLVMTLAGTTPSLVFGDCFLQPHTNSR